MGLLINIDILGNNKLIEDDGLFLSSIASAQELKFVIPSPRY